MLTATRDRTRAQSGYRPMSSEPRKTLWITRIQDWTLNRFQVLCSNPQTILPPLFSPGSPITTLLYFGLIPIAKSTNPADETQISVTWQHMIHSVLLHSGQERGLHHCREVFDLFPVLCIFRLGLTLRCGPSLRHLRLSTRGWILPHGLNFATWTKFCHVD